MVKTSISLFSRVKTILSSWEGQRTAASMACNTWHTQDPSLIMRWWRPRATWTTTKETNLANLRLSSSSSILLSVPASISKTARMTGPWPLASRCKSRTSGLWVRKRALQSSNSHSVLARTATRFSSLLKRARPLEFKCASITNSAEDQNRTMMYQDIFSLLVLFKPSCWLLERKSLTQQL